MQLMIYTPTYTQIQLELIFKAFLMTCDVIFRGKGSKHRGKSVLCKCGHSLRLCSDLIVGVLGAEVMQIGSCVSLFSWFSSCSYN